jgi:hypothetical protein
VDIFSKLMLLAFFFAMRSCEYLQVDKSEERRTSPIRKRNIVFMKNHTVIPHSSPQLELADSVTIYFEFQKRDLRNDSVTQSKTGDPHDCPVRASAEIVRRMQRQGMSDDDFVFSFIHETTGRKTSFTSKVARDMLRSFIRSQPTNYGIAAEEIGLHSMRSSSAMAMYLNKVPVYTIMLLGRWSSDAFLRYIRRQVNTFGQDVSTKMIDTELFCHVPNPDHNDLRRTHNLHATTFNSGMGKNGLAHVTAFAVWA